ncbi:hypothetical protein P8452_60850 [Trifolium repens]|nr:hypothetical protein P8452_60850 [Trifolium repens]
MDITNHHDPTNCSICRHLYQVSVFQSEDQLDVPREHHDQRTCDFCISNNLPNSLYPDNSAGNSNKNQACVLPSSLILPLMPKTLYEGFSILLLLALSCRVFFSFYVILL